MDTYPRCATCRHWRRHSKDEPEEEPFKDYGWCDQFQLGLNDHRKSLHDVSPMVYPVTKTTDVSVRAGFGCVLHEPKE